MSILCNKSSSHRLSALIDGVFAIVMTILVLDIKVPHDPMVLRDFSIQQFLTGQFQDLLIYVVVFVMLADLWIIHHNEAQYIKNTEHNHLWLTMGYLMFIAVLPFSSALVNKFPEDEVAELFLASNMFVIGILNYGIWECATRNRALIEASLSNKQISAEKKKLIILPAVSMCAMVIAFILPIAASYVLLAAPMIMYFMELRWCREE